MAKKSAREIKQEKLELELAEKLQPFKMRFNDICMREYGLDITEEDDYVYDMDTESILQFKEKFIKYCEECNPYLKPNEIEFNLLENSRMMEALFAGFLSKYALRKGQEIVSMHQSNIQGTSKGVFCYSYFNCGKTIEVSSEPYVYESVRVLNLLCKMNKSAHMYNFEEFDQILKEAQDVYSNR